ncbi:hypothetical protein [uncultured Corynebacterium sp.]|uniref:hypothetical protein n=1 Tax=uncultured Corynebacterium sp. TaxID=159447 RepID=UPI002593BC63|nr:hypothetical protein [uncultured Corynebacterium sp.]
MANFGQIGAVVAVSALLGLGAAGATMSQINVPSPEAVAVNTVGAPTVVIDDPHDLLTPDDEARLTRDAQLLDAPRHRAHPALDSVQRERRKHQRHR